MIMHSLALMLGLAAAKPIIASGNSSGFEDVNSYLLGTSQRQSFLLTHSNEQSSACNVFWSLPIQARFEPVM